MKNQFVLHLLVDQLDNYVLSIKTIPNVEEVVRSSELFYKLGKFLQLKDADIELYYDTTFNLGYFSQNPTFKF